MSAMVSDKVGSYFPPFLDSSLRMARKYVNSLGNAFQRKPPVLIGVPLSLETCPIICIAP